MEKTLSNLLSELWTWVETAENAIYEIKVILEKLEEQEKKK